MPDKMQELSLWFDFISKFNAAYDRKRLQDYKIP